MRNILCLVRFLLTIAILTIFSFGCYAAYLRNVPTVVVNPDGTKIHCFASGDEYYNYLHDKAGYTIIQANDGYYYYATKKGDLVVPSEYRVTDGLPKSRGIKPNIRISEKEYKKRVNAFWADVSKSDSKAPHTGTMNNLVIYISFSDDTEFTTPRSEYDSKFSPMDQQSLRDYFDEVSYGNLNIQSTHYPEVAMSSNLSYKDTHPRSYFQPYNAGTNTNGYQTETERRIREHQLLVDAVTWINANSPVPAELNIDGDSDGNVDNVCFIIRGNKEGWSDLLWAHRWVLWTYEVSINGKRVWDYTFQPENQTDTYTLCHEMFHALGAPDLYHYNTTGFTPVGPWDLMESGFVHMGAYMKWKYANSNWISDIPVISGPGVYTLNPLTSSTDNVYRINSPNSATEYFILEYRKQQGFYESNIPGNGLLIYRINTSVGDGNADGPPDEVYIYRPGGTSASNGTINSAHFSSNVGRTFFNDNTNPSCFLSDNNSGGINITNITEAGETISFSIQSPTNLVTFNLDMSGATGFDPQTHNVYLTGNFTGWTQPGQVGSILMEKKTETATYFYEDFSGSFPAGWTNNVIAGPDGFPGWEWTMDGGNWGGQLASTTAGNGYVKLDSDAHGANGVNEEVDLISPPIDLSSATSNITLSLEHIARTYGMVEIYIYISVNDFASQTLLYEWKNANQNDFNTIDGSGPDPNVQVFEADITALAAGQSNVKLKFKWKGSWDYWWLIDDVRITANLPGESLLYTTTREIESGEIQYKYFSDAFGAGWNGGEWSGDPNRVVNVTGNMEIEDTWGVINNPGPHTVTFTVKNQNNAAIEGAKIIVTPVGGKKIADSNQILPDAKKSLSVSRDFTSRQSQPAIIQNTIEIQKADKPVEFLPNNSKGGNWIHWDDGTNNSSVGAGTSTLTIAARFEPADIASYHFNLLEKISVFINNAPLSATVKIWQGYDENSLTEVVSQSFTAVATSWNEIILTTPYIVDADKELWIGCEMNVVDGSYSPGIDAASDYIGKGNKVKIGTGAWANLSDYSIAGDWNIQAYINDSKVLFTDGNGQTSLQGMNGDYVFTVEKEGYVIFEDNFTIENQDRSIQVTLQEQANTVVDIDGNVYPTVMIGEQEWIAKNLRVLNYNNGDPITTGLDNTQWGSTTEGAYAIYPHAEIEGLNSDVDVLEAYGALYNWYAVDDVRGLCPTGWKVPSDEDWTELTTFVGGESVAGGKLKSTRTAPDAHPRWDSTNEGATDEFGFSAFPGGYREGFDGPFFNVGKFGGWWSSTEGEIENAGAQYLNFDYENVYLGYWKKSFGFSIRCLRDNETEPTLYLLGDATSAGWNNTAAIPMDYIDNGVFEKTIDLNEGLYIKFIGVLGQWAPQWGTNETGTSVSGPLVFRETEFDTDPMAIPAPVPGTYKIVADIENLTYSITLISGTVIDIDGNVYPTIVIGEQEWMAKNLMAIHYNSGDPITTGLDNSSWTTTPEGAYAIYPHADIEGLNSDAEVLEAYGALYNWYAVDDLRGLCPTGWRVPSDEDWFILENFVDPTINDPNATDWRGIDGGTKLKAESGWSNSGNGTDTYDFSALPGGCRFTYNGGQFFGNGSYGLWWTSRTSSSNSSWARHIDYDKGGMFRLAENINDGFSIRCIKGEEPEFDGGSGTEEDPWQIANATHLNNVRNYLGAEHSDKFFVQTADIDLGGAPWNVGEGWMPIGTASSKFYGNYDGGFYTIDGLYINRPAVHRQGLFGIVDDALIGNIKLIDVNITGASSIGALVGQSSNSDIYNVMSSGTVTGNYYVGGITGFNTGGNFISQCFSSATITGIENVGGIAGVHQSRTVMTNCYSLSNITGTNYVGGLVGTVAAEGDIENSFFAGSIAGDTEVGGLIGRVLSVSSVFNSFWDIETSGVATSVGGGEAKSTLEMKSIITFTSAGWDFQGLGVNGIWNIESNDYPFLSWLCPDCIDPEVNVLPNVLTNNTTEVNQNGATVSLTVTCIGNPTATQYGVCWNLTGEPTVLDGKTTEGAVTEAGDFVSIITGLEVDKTYYVRAYASNSEGTAYGNELSFITFSVPEGDGSSANPYLISSLSHLYWLTSTQSVWDKYFVQTDDIDAAETISWNSGEGWMPIGTLETPFTGNYDGNGNSVRNLYVNRPYNDCVGLFGSIEYANISQLSVVNAEIYGKSYVGCIAGLVSENSSVDECFSTGSVTGYGVDAGGLVGRLFNGSNIVNSYSDCNVTGFQGAAGQGGLLGGAYSSSVINSFSFGAVNSPYANGLIGWSDGSTFENCYWDTEASGIEYSAGGEGRTTNQMVYPYDEGTYVYWDFTNVWKSDVTGTVNDGYPFLKIFINELTIEGLTASNKVYDGETSAIISNYGTLIGKLSEDHDVSLVTTGASAAFSSKTVGNNKIVTVTGLTLTGADAHRYYIANSFTAKANITTKTLTVVNATASKVYDGGTAAPITGAELNGIIGADAVTLTNSTTGTYAQANVGSSIVVTTNMGLAGTDAGNYTIQQPSILGEILQRNLTITANNITKAFGTEYVFTGQEFTTGTMYGSDEVTSVTITSAGSAIGAAVGNYPIAPSAALGVGLTNYNISYSDGVMSVTNLREVTLSGIIAHDREYDGSTSVVIDDFGTLQGVLPEDEGEVWLVQSIYEANLNLKNAGVGKTVTISGLTLGGDNAYKYFINNQYTTVDIAKRPLTAYNFTADSRVYDGTSAVTGAAFADDRVGGDLLDFSYLVSFADKNVGVAKVVSFTDIELIGGSDAGNYTLVTTSGSTTADITVRTLTLSNIEALDKPYDGSLDATLTFDDDRILGDLLEFTYDAQFASLNAGENITVYYGNFAISGGADKDNYTLYPSKIDPYAGETTASIEPRDLTLSNFSAQSKVYDATPDANNPTFDDDRIPGDDLNISFTAQFTDKNVANNKTVNFTNINVSGGTSVGNYKLVTTSGSVLANITPATLTLSSFTANSKEYDGTTSVTGAGFSDNRFTNDVLTFTYSAAFDGKDIGIDKDVLYTGISISGGADMGNYTLASTSGTAKASITAKTLTVGGSFTALDKVYNGNVNASIGTNSLTLTGIISGETVTLSPVLVFDTKHIGPNKPVSLSPTTSLSGADKNNYALSLTLAPSATASITAKAVTIGGGFTVANREYDGTVTAAIATNSLTITDAVSGDNVTLNPVAEFSSKSVGTAKVINLTASTALSGTDAGNYTLSLSGAPGATANITAKALTVTGATAASKVYDGNTTATISGATLTGVVGTEVVTLANHTSGTFANKNVGTDVTVSTAMTLSGADAGNYTVTQPTGLKANITAKELTVGGTFTVANREYDGTAAATAATNALTLTGKITDDVVTLTSVLSFANKNVGTAKVVSLGTTSALAGADSGNYTLSLTGAPTTTANITAKALTVTGTTVANKVYDGTSVATLSGATLNGTITPDVVTLANHTSGTFTSKNVGTDVAVSTAMTLSGADAVNYTVTQPTGLKANITALGLTIGGSFTALDKEFDGTTAATIDQNNLTLLTPIAGDAVTLNGVVVQFANADAGEDKVVSITAAELNGADKGNYSLSLTGAPTATASITMPVGTYSLTLLVNPENAGTVTGAGAYQEDEQVTITATPAEGFRFLNWRFEGAVISDEASFTYAMPAADVTLVAHFIEESAETYTLTLVANPIIGGLVIGGGEFAEGEVVTVAAQTNEGYLFISWTDAEGNEVSALTSFEYTMPAADVSLTANFELDVILYNVTFIVTENSVAIDGANISINGQNLTTDAEGIASIELENGVYPYTVSKQGFVTEEGSVTVDGDDVTENVSIVHVSINTNQLSSISIYPNPFSSSITLNNASKASRVVITNLIGQWVMDIKLSGAECETIQTSELVNGIYLIQIYSENGEKVIRKMIKE